MDPYGFLGKGLKFPLQVDKKTGHIATSSHEEDIREAIGIILNTGLGERVMRPDFGTNIQDYVFNPTTMLAAQNVEGTLRSMLELQEPRIKDIEVKMIQDESNNVCTIVFEISYTVRVTNNRHNHVYPFYMEEGNKEGTII